ncbi:hypothetical protein FRC09_008773 [Ceratobasidium sp. 395]|nr:hypothetical protein FRC09_008773 [Ceratobasidium sp. 395]
MLMCLQGLRAGHREHQLEVFPDWQSEKPKTGNQTRGRAAQHVEPVQKTPTASYRGASVGANASFKMPVQYAPVLQKGRTEEPSGSASVPEQQHDAPTTRSKSAAGRTRK